MCCIDERLSADDVLRRLERFRCGKMSEEEELDFLEHLDCCQHCYNATYLAYAVEEVLRGHVDEQWPKHVVEADAYAFVLRYYPNSLARFEEDFEAIYAVAGENFHSSDQDQDPESALMVAFHRQQEDGYDPVVLATSILYAFHSRRCNARNAEERENFFASALPRAIARARVAKQVREFLSQFAHE